MEGSVLQLLLEAKAEVGAKDNMGLTPLIMAVQSDCRPIVRYLLRARATLDARDRRGLTALDHAESGGYRAIAKLLRSALKRGGRTAVVLLLEDDSHAFAAGCAVPRVLPEYSRKNETTGKAKRESDASTVAVAFLSTDPIPERLLDQLRASGEGIRQVPGFPSGL